MRILLAAKRRSDIATKWRKVIAMGVSPWNIENTTRRVPKGRKELGHSLPSSGLRGSPLFVLPNPWARAG